MKKQIIYLFAFALFLLSHSSFYAQSPDTVLKRAVKAVGGEKVLRSIWATQINGTITRLSDGNSGGFQAQTIQPNLYITSFDLNGFETERAYNGKSGWIRDSKNGLRTLTGQASRDFQAEASYRNNRWLNYKQEKSKLTYRGQSNVNGMTADVLTLTTVKGVSIKMFFDTASGLLIRDEIPVGESVYVSDYSDFHPIDNLQEPFTINTTDGSEKYEIKLNSVIHNSQISKAVFDFPNLSTEPLPNIPALLKELQANEDRIEDILENYTFTQTNTMRDLNKEGTLTVKESETFQLTFYKGNRIRRLVAKNGNPLSTNDQAKEDKKIERQITDIEKDFARKEARAAKQSSDEPADENNKRISVAEILRASNLINPRRERFRNRDVIVFDFEPNPDFDFKNTKSLLKFFGKTAGVMWIDAQDKQVARLEAVLSSNYKVGGGILANLKKGAAFTLENERINDEVWLPLVTDINLSVKVLLVKGININQVIKYSDYQKFNSEVKDSKVDEIRKPRL